MTDTIGKRIIHARGVLGWTQEDLAQKLGKAYQQVSVWERDESTPRAKNLHLLAKTLGVEVPWIEKGIGPMRVSDPAIGTAGFILGSLDRLSEGADVLVIGQALQAILKALPARGISLDDPRLGALFQAVIRRAVQTGVAPDERAVLEELMKPS